MYPKDGSDSGSFVSIFGLCIAKGEGAGKESSGIFCQRILLRMKERSLELLRELKACGNRTTEDFI